MGTIVCKDRYSLGRQAAELTAQAIREAAERTGRARLLLSAGESQLETHVALMAMTDVPWDKTELFFLDTWDQVKFFHLDRKTEYNGQLIPDWPEKHLGSYRKYIREHVGTVHFLDDPAEDLQVLCDALAQAPLDVALIGMGQKAHMVFYGTDSTDASYIPVGLPDSEMEEWKTGWLENECPAPEAPVSVSLEALRRSGRIILSVPVEAVAPQALEKTLGALAGHPQVTVLTNGEQEVAL